MKEEREDRMGGWKGGRKRKENRSTNSPPVQVGFDPLALWLPAREYLGAPVEGEGEGDMESMGAGSGMHSLILNLRQ